MLMKETSYKCIWQM